MRMCCLPSASFRRHEACSPLPVKGGCEACPLACAAPEDRSQGYGGATGGTPTGAPESQVAREVRQGGGGGRAGRHGQASSPMCRLPLRAASHTFRMAPPTALPCRALALPQVKSYAARVQEEGQQAGEESYEGSKVGRPILFTLFGPLPLW